MIKDKYLDDLLAIEAKVLRERPPMAVFIGEPHPADILAGLAVREIINIASPATLKALDKAGMAPGGSR